MNRARPPPPLWSTERTIYHDCILSASTILLVVSRFMNDVPNFKFFITGWPETRARSGFCFGSLISIMKVLELSGVWPEVPSER